MTMFVLLPSHVLFYGQFRRILIKAQDIFTHEPPFQCLCKHLTCSIAFPHVFPLWRMWHPIASRIPTQYQVFEYSIEVRQHTFLRTSLWSFPFPSYCKLLCISLHHCHWLMIIQFKLFHRRKYLVDLIYFLNDRIIDCLILLCLIIIV